MSLSTSAESSAGQSVRIPRELVVRRLFSLSGVIPLGVFVTIHFATLLSAVAGPNAFEAVLGSGSRARIWVEALLIGVPLVFHALLGIRLTLTSRVNVGRYPFAANWAHALERWSGLVLFLFLAWHLWETRIVVLLGRRAPADFYGDLSASLSSTGALGIPFFALGYLLGVVAVSYHLSNGITGCCASFGLITSAAAYRRVARYAAAFGVVLFLLGASSVIYFATGWSPLSFATGAG